MNLRVTVYEDTAMRIEPETGMLFGNISRLETTWIPGYGHHFWALYNRVDLKLYYSIFYTRGSSGHFTAGRRSSR